MATKYFCPNRHSVQLCRFMQIRRPDEATFLEREEESHQQGGGQDTPPPVYPPPSLVDRHVSRTDGSDERTESETKDVYAEFASTLVRKVDVRDRDGNKCFERCGTEAEEDVRSLIITNMSGEDHPDLGYEDEQKSPDVDCASAEFCDTDYLLARRELHTLERRCFLTV